MQIRTSSESIAANQCLEALFPRPFEQLNKWTKYIRYTNLNSFDSSPRGDKIVSLWLISRWWCGCFPPRAALAISHSPNIIQLLKWCGMSNLVLRGCIPPLCWSFQDLIQDTRIAWMKKRDGRFPQWKHPTVTVLRVGWEAVGGGREGTSEKRGGPAQVQMRHGPVPSLERAWYLLLFFTSATFKGVEHGHCSSPEKV